MTFCFGGWGVRFSFFLVWGRGAAAAAACQREEGGAGWCVRVWEREGLGVGVGRRCCFFGSTKPRARSVVSALLSFFTHCAQRQHVFLFFFYIIGERERGHQLFSASGGGVDITPVFEFFVWVFLVFEECLSHAARSSRNTRSQGQSCGARSGRRHKDTLHARSPRMRRASWMSLGMMVTRLAWMAARLVSSKRPTR